MKDTFSINLEWEDSKNVLESTITLIVCKL